MINHYKKLITQIEEINIGSVDYILCLNDTEQHWENMIESIAPQGKICSIVEPEEAVDLTALKNKSVNFTWGFMFEFNIKRWYNFHNIRERSER